MWSMWRKRESLRGKKGGDGDAPDPYFDTSSFESMARPLSADDHEGPACLIDLPSFWLDATEAARLIHCRYPICDRCGEL